MDLVLQAPYWHHCHAVFPQIDIVAYGGEDHHQRWCFHLRRANHLSSSLHGPLAVGIGSVDLLILIIKCII